MSVADTKPEPIRVGVEGIKPTPIELTPAATDELRVSWQTVGALPAFQMFVNEQAPCPSGRDQEQWAIDYGVRYGAKLGDQVLLERYAQWHEAKGYWPNETIFGEARV